MIPIVTGNHFFSFLIQEVESITQLSVLIKVVFVVQLFADSHEKTCHPVALGIP